uniref:SWI/SNF-related matrix-associated actin-dependent regulator of chromatin subfamily A containing DEAD/H box 1 n=1 Tax=Anthurium amnicola TaxID=1678845 RepID=A0A1D1Z8D6_9ARAE
MACWHITRSGFSPVLGLRPGFHRRRSSGLVGGGVLPFRCCLRDDNTSSNGEEPPESLFKKELKRRGMNPTSLSEDSVSSSGSYSGLAEEMEVGEELNDGGSGRGPVKRNGVVSADYDKDLANQRERSMSLNSEGLEGLVPRAKLLLTVGGTFFWGFWPLMLITVGIFSALYFYFGSSFVHDTSKMRISPPPYVDPYALLEDDKISQSAPHVD